VGISTCLLIVLPSILYHASLNSRACFVCARPSRSVSVQLKVYGSCRMCVLQVVIYNRIVLWRFCVFLAFLWFFWRFCVKKDKTDDILHTINNTTENIKFTKEEEDNNQLAFLDILLTRTDDGTINTQVYRKKTHTDQILNFNSNHPTQHKISCIRSLFNRKRNC
jgi:hypothetical protein